MSETTGKEGNRIDYFIRAMRQCGCRFDSGQMPVFSKRGALEFWEGGFFYKPGRIDLVGKVTLDHSFITFKLTRRLPRELAGTYRESIHLLMTANQCHYYFEPCPEDGSSVFLVLAKYIYATEPPGEEVQIVLDMLSHAVQDLEKGIGNGFDDWKPRYAF